MVSVEQARLLMESGGTIFVDLRPKEDYERSHIPGALNLSIDALYESLEEKSTRIPKGSGVVFYGMDGEDSGPDEAAEILVMMGYDNIAILTEGWVAWKEAGMPMTFGSSTLRPSNAKRP